MADDVRQLKQDGKSFFPKIKTADNLTTEDSETALSAKQGKVLNESKIDKLGKEPGSGEEYHFPFNFNAITQEPDKIKTSIDTITLDGKKTKLTYGIEIPAANPDADRAGLLTKELYDSKIDKLGNEPGSGEPYHIPFNFNEIVQSSDGIQTSFDTITLDGNKTKKTYDISIPPADPISDKAGLLTKTLYDGKSKVMARTGAVAGASTIHSLKIDGKDYNLPEGEGGTVVIPSEQPLPSAKNLAGLLINDEAWNVQEGGGGGEEFVDVAMTFTSRTEFEGTVTEDQFEKLKNRTHRLRSALTIPDELGGGVCTVYSTDIINREKESGGITNIILYGMFSTGNSTIATFGIHNGNLRVFGEINSIPSDENITNIANKTIHEKVTYGQKLGEWDCVNGTPVNPYIHVGDPYQEGCYYEVSVVAGDPTKNLMPEGTVPIGRPSTTYYTGTEVVVKGGYFSFKNRQWGYHTTIVHMIGFNNVSGDPTDNPAFAKYMEEFAPEVEIEDIEGLREELDEKALKTQLSDGSVTKVGTDNVGSETQPFYLNKGVPTAGKYTLNDACTAGIDKSISDKSTDDNLATGHAVFTAVDGKVDKKEGYSLSKITFNDEVTDTPSFYAPTTKGLKGQLFGSDGTSTGWVSIAAVLRFKGTKDTLTEITELTDMEIGDVWFCIETNTYWAYNGTHWDNIGSSIDLVGYQTKLIGSPSDKGKILGVDANGKISVLSTSAGDSATPIYLKGGMPTSMDADIGSSKNPVYLTGGKICPSEETVGAANTVVYLMNGVFTPGIKISSGTGDPPQDGKDGDIYIQYSE